MTDTSTPAPPEQAEEPTARPHTGWRSRTTQRTAARAIAAAAAVGGAVAGCAPTGTVVVDLAFTGAFAGLVTLAASRSKRWPAFAPVAVAVALARDGVLAFALAAAATALVGATRRRRDRIWGAATGALAVQALLRLPDLGFHGATVLIATVAVAPVLVSGYRTCRSHVRRRIRRVLTVAGGLAAAIGLAYGALALSVAHDLERATTEARNGLSAVREGETEQARSHFARSTSAFTRADARLNAWWTAPARAVPVLAQHAHALGGAAAEGQQLSATAGETAASADYQQLRYTSGRFDLDRIRAVEEPLGRTRSTIDSARRSLADDDSGWLLAPLADGLDEFDAELAQAQVEADVAGDAVTLAPGLLGGEGARRYLVAFVTPAEVRGSGGFMGSWAEVTADGGELRLTESGPVRELMPDFDGPPLTISGPREYLDRYGRFSSDRYVGDFAFSPHFPYDAEVLAELYPQATGREVDGVISVDPVALAALLTFTGPLDVPGFDRTLTADNAAEFLLRDNYSLFPNSNEQNEALARLVEITFDRLTTGDLPSPRSVADTMSPATQQGRLRMWSPRPEEQDLFGRIGATGAFPRPRDGRDFFAVSSQNAGNNKIDAFQSRMIDYDVEVADDGTLAARARITIRNDAPTDGRVPEYVVGNAQGDPLGTNRMFLSVHTPHQLEQATLDGLPVGMEVQREAGYPVYSRYLSVPPGGEVTVELRLRGTAAPDGEHVLDLAPHPMVVPDQVTVRYRETGHEPVVLPSNLTEGRRSITLRVGDS